MINRTARLFILAGLIILGLEGCTSTPSTSIDSPRTHTGMIDAREANRLMAIANERQSPYKEELTLEIIKRLNFNQNSKLAIQSLKGLNTNLLSDEKYRDYALIYSQLLMEDQAYFDAQRILTETRLQQQWSLFNTPERITLHERRADLFMLLSETQASIEERFTLQSLLGLDRNRKLENQRNLWQSLMALSVTELTSLKNNAVSNNQQGWYELALISKDNQSDLENQLSLINNWKYHWQGHPAGKDLPRDLELLQELINERPQSVALLLPQAGKLEKAGKSIRDGFIAAYYQARRQGRSVPTLKFYDTSEGTLNAYQAAINDGAEFVVGPLDKKNVSQLSTLDSLPVPTLALNYANGDHSTHNLYQLALSADNEARPTAQRAWVEGHRTAMVLSTNANWGQRSAAAFIETWQSLGGTVVSQSKFLGNGDYSDVVKAALQIDESEKRARELRRLLGKEFEFEPRRRQDIDVIFLIARPSDARQIKPTLAFHYAGSLPVYASSHVYSGAEDIKSDRDLNGVMFSTLPWVINEESAEKQLINTTVKPSASYQKLYALGVDSFQLYPRLRQLQESPQVRFYGATGSMYLGENNRIEREQLWAIIKNGKVQAMPSIKIK